MSAAEVAAREIDDLVRGFYGVFDNRGGRKPAVSHVTAFFHDSAVIAKKGDAGFETYNPVQFALPRVELLLGTELVDFHEWETSANTQVAGELATRVSRYEKSGTYAGAPWHGTGTKTFQLVFVDSCWKILSLAWVDDVSSQA